MGHTFEPICCYWNAPRALRQAETRVIWPVGYSKLENRNYRKRYNRMCTEIRGNISVYCFLDPLRNCDKTVVQLNARKYWFCEWKYFLLIIHPEIIKQILRVEPKSFQSRTSMNMRPWIVFGAKSYPSGLLARWFGLLACWFVGMWSESYLGNL